MADCGVCSLCCKLMRVPKVTEAGEWCQHCKPGKGGCGIYDTRPDVCVEFECGWLANDGEARFRPDRIHMVVGGSSEIWNAYVVYVDPNYPGAPETPLGRKLLQTMISAGRWPNVILITGNKRRIIGNDTGMVQRRLAELEAADTITVQ